MDLEAPPKEQACFRRSLSLRATERVADPALRGGAHETRPRGGWAGDLSPCPPTRSGSRPCDSVRLLELIAGVGAEPNRNGPTRRGISRRRTRGMGLAVPRLQESKRTQSAQRDPQGAPRKASRDGSRVLEDPPRGDGSSPGLICSRVGSQRAVSLDPAGDCLSSTGPPRRSGQRGLGFHVPESNAARGTGSRRTPDGRA